MFKFQYEIQSPNGELVWLFGEDYYTDKKVFWDAHQKMLKNLHLKVTELGFPIVIKNFSDNMSFKLNCTSDFELWLKKNQPYHQS